MITTDYFVTRLDDHGREDQGPEPTGPRTKGPAYPGTNVMGPNRANAIRDQQGRVRRRATQALLRAYSAACVRLEMSSLRRMEVTWFLTVFSLMPHCRAICRFVRPSET